MLNDRPTNRARLSSTRSAIGIGAGLALLAGLLTPGLAVATHIDLTWMTSGVATWNWAGGADARTVSSTFDAFQIEPGDPVTVSIHGMEYHYFDPGPEGCDDGNPADSTVPVAELFLFKVDAGETIFDWFESPQTAELIVLPGSGTHHTSTHTCINPTAPPRNEFASDILFTFSSAATAGLAAGCYQPSPYNPHLNITPAPVGSIAVLSVGGFDCSFSDPGILTVTAGYSYSGVMAANAAGLIGTDSIAVSGTPAGLALVSHVCVSSTWSATVQIRVAATLRFGWNETLALGLPETTAVLVGKPDKKGQFKGMYSESVTWQRCVAGTSRSFPALPIGTGLALLHTSPFTAISHSSTVWAVLLDGRTIAVPLSPSKAKPGSISWSKSATATLDLR